MNRHLNLFAMLSGLILFALAAPAWSIPAHINISGELLDSKGEPILYYDDQEVEVTAILDAKITFYDSPTATVSFAIIPTTATAYNGFFNIRLPLPDVAATKSGLWYTVSLDVDRNGLTSSDRFPNRFEVGSVPFALSAKPVTFFTTFSGTKDGGAMYHLYKNTLMVVPFEAPAGGVEFNQMNIVVTSIKAGTAFSFGIYDEQGKLIVPSGLITTKTELADAFLQVKHQKLKLIPSGIYYIGVARSDGWVMLPQGMKPAAPILGTVWTPYTDGNIPASFHPSNIDPNRNVCCLPVTLCLIDDSATSSGSAWVASKPGGPQYRWIQGGKGDMTVIDER